MPCTSNVMKISSLFMAQLVLVCNVRESQNQMDTNGRYKPIDIELLMCAKVTTFLTSYNCTEVTNKLTMVCTVDWTI